MTEPTGIESPQVLQKRVLGLAWLIRLTPEWILAGLTLLSFSNVVFHFVQNGFLAQPFLFIQDDTLMDWFNPAFWAWRPGAYNIWKTVYPPLSFVLLKFTTLPQCYVDSPISARDCDWYAKIWIVVFYAVSVFLAAKAFHATDVRTAWLRSVSFAIGLPILFTLERGNLLIAALPFFILAYGPLRSPRWIKAVSMAITINFKPYLVVPALAYGLKRNWRLAELAALLAIALYLLTLAILGEGTISQIQANTKSFLSMAYEQAFGQMFYSTSYAPLKLLGESGFPLKQFLGSRTIDLASKAIPAVISASLAIAGIAVIAAWVQPRSASTTRLALITICAFFAYQSPGGYAFIFVTYLVLLEKWDRVGPAIAIVCGYILLFNFDYILAPVGRLYREAWLSGLVVSNSFGVSVGQFLRPALCVLILWVLAIDTILQSVKAHRVHRPVIGFALSEARVSA